MASDWDGLVNFQMPFRVEHVKIGSLVSNKDKPHQDACQVKTAVLDVDVIKEQGKDVSSALDSVSGGHLSVWLTKFLSLHTNSSKATRQKLNSSELGVYQLKNPKQWFKEICKEKAAKEYIEETAMDNEDVYLIVGYAVLRDIASSQDSESDTSLNVRAEVPIDEIAQVPGVDLANVGAAGGFVSASGGQREMFYPGDRIFKVGFRKIKWGFLDEKTAEKARLSGPRKETWKPVSAVSRGESEEEEWIECELGDEAEELVYLPEDVVVPK